MYDTLQKMSFCYCDMCPTMVQLSSMHQQWFHILPHAETPLWMQCQSSQHCPKCTTTTLQVPTWHCFLVVQPAPSPPAQCMQPTPTAPATPATKMNQAPAVPVTPAVQRNALAPMPVTSHVTPVPPQRSSPACMAPRHLIQEIWELLTRTVHRPCYCNVPPYTSSFIVE